ncbi:MAG: hypothetical protein AB8B86_12055 [Pseudomonadales bacterium]
MTGLLLSIASAATVFATWSLWLKTAFRQAVPDNIAGFVLAMTTGLGLSITAFYSEPGVLGSLVATVASFMSLFWLLVTAAGKQKTDTPKIVIGRALPAFTALNEDGSPFDSQSLDGNPYLIKFFRGHW